MKLKNIFLVGAMVALLGSQSALAAVVTATYNGAARLGNAVGVGYDSGWVSPGPSGTGGNNVLIGGDSFTAVPDGSFLLPPGAFDAWCVDVWHWLSTPTSTFTVAGASTLANTLATEGGYLTSVGIQRVADLNKLANAH